jgi:hypothetical protein
MVEHGACTKKQKNNLRLVRNRKMEDQLEKTIKRIERVNILLIITIIVLVITLIAA